MASKENDFSNKDQPPGEVTRLIDHYLDLENQGIQISLDELCQANPYLRESVASQIEAIQQMDGLLDSLVSDSAADASCSRSGLGKRTGNATATSQYLIRRFHAHGGCSEVYVAEDTTLGRTVAIKFLRPEMKSNNTFKTRLRREAQITSRLDHPGIVSILANGDDENGQPFYTMRFVEGDSMAERIKSLHQSNDPSSLPEFRRLINHFVDACQTVAYAHDRGIIHRDIKPANIVTGNFGETFLIDWGLARFVSSEIHEPTTLSDSNTDFQAADTHAEQLTQMGNIIGTPAFMSPEHANGEGVGKSSDVFCLGATLYAILSGTAPFCGNSVIEVVSRAQNVDYRKLSLKKSTIPGPLISICEKAMAVDPSNRYETAQQLAGDVENFLAGAQVIAYQENLTEQTFRWIKNHRTLVTTVLTTCAASLVILSSATWLLVKSNQNLQQREAEAVYLKGETSKALVEATQNLYAQQIALAHSELNKNNVVRAQEILNGCPTEFRSWEWHLLNSMIDVQRPSLTLPMDETIVTGFDFSPSASILAVGRPDGKIQLIDTSSENSFELIETLDDRMEIAHVAFSPDGNRLAICGQEMREGKNRGAIHLWDTKSRKMTRRRWGHGRRILCVAWSSDGSRIATGGTAGGIRIRDSRSLAPEIRIDKAHPGEVRSVAFVDDSTEKVISIGDKGVLKEWDADGELLKNEQSHLGEANCMTVVGESVFTGGTDRLVRQWGNAERFEANRVYPGNKDHVVSIDVSPDGRFIVSGGLDRNVRIWDTGSGELVTTLRHHTSHVRKVLFDPIGKYFATSGDDGGINIWSMSKVLKPQPAGNFVRFSGVSSQLLCVSSNELAIWNANQHQLILRDTNFSSQVGQVAVAHRSDSFVSLHKNGSVIYRRSNYGLRPFTMQETKSSALQATFTSDDSAVIVAHRDGTLNCWDLEEKKVVRSGKLPGPASGIEFASDKRFLVVSLHSGRLIVLDFATLKPRYEIKAHPKIILSLSVHPSEPIAATTGKDGLVKIWDLQTGGLVDSFEFGASWMNCLAFTPDGKRLVAGSEHTVLFWDTDRRQEVLSISVNRCVHSISFSHDGKFMAVAGEDPFVRIWQVGPDN